MGLPKALVQRWHHPQLSSSSSQQHTHQHHQQQHSHPIPSNPSNFQQHSSSPSSFPILPLPSNFDRLPTPLLQLQRNARSLDHSVSPSSLKLPSSILGVKVPNRRGLAFGLTLDSCLQSNPPLKRPDPSFSKLIPGLLTSDTDKFIPPIALRCLEYLNQRGPQEEGIYRIPGRSTDVEKLRFLFDAGCDIDLLKHTIGTLDPHAVASTFKLWLRELPHSLLSLELHIQVNQIISLYTGLESTSRRPATPQGESLPSGQLEQCVAKLSDILPNLPLPNWHLLRAIAHHLSILSQSSSTNKMTLSNLRLILSPTLKFTPVFLQLLVQHRHSLFKLPCRFSPVTSTVLQPSQHPVLSRKSSSSSPQLSFPSLPTIPSSSIPRPKTAAPQIPCTTTTTINNQTQTRSNPPSSVPSRSRYQSCAAATSPSSLSSEASLPTITCTPNWASSEDSLRRFMFHSPPVHSAHSPEPATPTPWLFNGSTLHHGSSSPTTASRVISQSPTTITFSPSHETPHTLLPRASPTPIGDMFTLSSRPPLPSYSCQVSPVSSLLTRARTKSFNTTSTPSPPPLNDQGNLTTSSTKPDRTIFTSCIQNQNMSQHDQSLGPSAPRDPTGASTCGHPTPIPWLSSRPPSPSSMFPHSPIVSPTSLAPSMTNGSKTPIADLYKRSEMLFTSSKSPPSPILDSRPELPSQQQQQQQQEKASCPISQNMLEANPGFQNVNPSLLQPTNLEQSHRRGPSEATSGSTLLQSDDDDDDDEKRKCVLNVVLKKTTEDKEEDKDDERPLREKADRASVMTVLATGGRLTERE